MGEIPSNNIECDDCGITIMHYDGYLSSMSNVLCDRCYHVRIKRNENL